MKYLILLLITACSSHPIPPPEEPPVPPTHVSIYRVGGFSTGELVSYWCERSKTKISDCVDLDECKEKCK